MPFLSTKRKVSILLNFSFPSVSFEDIILDLEMRNFGLKTTASIECLTIVLLLRIFV